MEKENEHEIRRKMQGFRAKLGTRWGRFLPKSSKFLAVALFLLLCGALMVWSTTTITDTDIEIDGVKHWKTEDCVVDVNSRGDYIDLQSCIDLIDGGGTIKLNNGTETVTSSITINNKKNMKIIGSGNSMLKADSSLTSPIISINNSVDIEIEGVTFDCNNASTRIFEAFSNDGLVIKDSKFSNLEVQDKCYVQLVANDNLQVQGNYFNNLGIINILDCTGDMGCSNNYDTGDNPENRSEFVSFIGNTINNSRDSGLSTNAHYITISGNTIKKTENNTLVGQVGYGIDTFGKSTYFTISGNTIDVSGSTSDGIRIQGTGGGEIAKFAKHGTIVGNIITNANRNCIATTGGVNQVSITANILRNCTSKALLLGYNVTAWGNHWDVGDTSDIAGLTGLPYNSAYIVGDIYTNKTIHTAGLETNNITAKGSQIDIPDPIVMTAKLTSTTIDTGQGAKEVYGMDQDVLTSSVVEHDKLGLDGVSSPNFPIHVGTSGKSGNGDIEIAIQPNTGTNTSSPQRIAWSRDSDGWTPAAIGQTYVGAYGGDLHLMTKPVGGSGNINSPLVRLTVKENGRVGIGTTIPNNQLEVVGNGNFTGAIYGNDYYSGDGTQGMTGSCGSNTTLTVKDGLITACS